MNSNKECKIKGFTLIELLVVMAIIGILAGVTLVSVNNSRTRAMRAKSLSTTRSFLPAIMDCYLQGYYSGTGSTTLRPGIDPACTGSPIVAPAIPCKSTYNWFVYYDNYAGGATYPGLIATVSAWCDQTNPYNYIRCYFTGSKSGVCEDKDYGDFN